jgi:predicted transcriptional regulator of viral defense system
MHRKEAIDRWQRDLFKKQEQMKKYITIQQAGEYFGIASTSHVRHMLGILMRHGKAERVKVGLKWHYHIIEGAK